MKFFYTVPRPVCVYVDDRGVKSVKHDGDVWNDEVHPCYVLSCVNEQGSHVIMSEDVNDTCNICQPVSYYMYRGNILHQIGNYFI